ncbi:MAG: hypothetical protein AB9856_20905 [Cellulosilyticaceae bacterium]
MHSNKAIVIEVADKGVKLKIGGEDLERNTYYNSIATVNVGDTVLIQWIGNTPVVLGKLLY